MLVFLFYLLSFFNMFFPCFLPIVGRFEKCFPVDSKTCLSTEIGAVLILFNVVFAPCRLCLKEMNRGYFVHGLYLPDISVFSLLIMSSLL
jgi:hypothetical protein